MGTKMKASWCGKLEKNPPFSLFPFRHVHVTALIPDSSPLPPIQGLPHSQADKPQGSDGPDSLHRALKGFIMSEER